MNIISSILLALRRTGRTLLLSGVLFPHVAAWAGDIPATVQDFSAAPVSQPSPPTMTLQPLLAQGSFESAVLRFTDFLKVVLRLIALIMCAWAGFLIHDGKIRESIYALTGAFILLVASLIVDSLARAAA